ncbi:hypothetical protein [Flaviaesturariibacter aridisoli]|uniref:Uncharacterized protein n=1 Tax=Flaviaesturariibacter aridisoli TaxID=2545761 RepID=A0A4V2WMR9_9BACT|nr:hypothetical protein [Flaviaesturariibacter aridisoli]TCZ72227.1 hypothetical protein E0486_09045 [Flaviaesturariibacter aridisoli]
MKHLAWILLLASCVGGSSRQDEEPPSTVDSQLLQVPADAAPVIDTDDHNKPSTEPITLDSPVGPTPGWDTVLEHPLPGKQ